MKTALALATLLLASALPAAARQTDARWAPWLGCWQMDPSKAEVCIAPAGAGVTLTTTVAGEPALQQTLVADGVARALTEAGCTGSQRTEWSSTGRTLFAHADLACERQPGRAISGLAFINGDGTWLDVQSIEVDGRASVRVRRYRRAGGADAAPGLARASRSTAGTGLTLDELAAAAGKVSPAVLEAAVAESGARWPSLRATQLIALADAGVPASVIDLVVAQSFPAKFQVERRQEASFDMYPPAFASAEWSGYWGLGYPYFSWYPGYYGNYRYYYSPFAYGYSGYYYPYAYYPGSLIVIGGDGGSDPQPSGDGRVVNGVGYTRIRTRAAVEAEANQSAGGSSRGRGTMTSSGATMSDSGGSNGGSSGGGGGASTGRTAIPK